MNQRPLAGPTVSVTIPVFNEEAHIESCLAAVRGQTYLSIVEILVVDGGSSDRTVELANASEGVTVLANPRRIQAAALNIALAEAKGEVVVRVDGHCVIAPDYVEQCVRALETSGAAMVGGKMTPVASGWVARGIARAMTSKWGAGPARFHVGGPAGFVDTVYLGAYPTAQARGVGGYAEDVGVNEDAEFAIRMRPHGGIWFDPSIASTYSPRSGLKPLARQFYRYGRSRAATVKRHPESLSPRQLAAPLLVLGLLSPARRRVAAAYLAIVAVRAALEIREDAGAAAGLGLSLPTMHLSWGTGFLLRLAADAARDLARTGRS
jgi:glycosyltransferase involved in cell wall biosynthesis